jgi:hypothetical protein
LTTSGVAVQAWDMNKSARWASRIGLTLASVLAAILNGSPLAVPVLLLMVYLLSVLVTQGRALVTAVEASRLRKLGVR